MNEEKLRALWLLSMSGDTKDFRPLLSYVRKVESEAYEKGRTSMQIFNEKEMNLHVKQEREAYEKGKKEALGNPLYIIDKDGSVNLTETIELAYQRGKKEALEEASAEASFRDYKD